MMKRILMMSSLLFSLSLPQYSSSTPLTASFILEEATIPSVETAIKTHRITCEQLIRYYLERIKKYNLSTGSKPPINAITEINPYVLEQARQLDQRYATSKKLIGPLHCIPVIIKDNIDSFDMTATSGSYALIGNQPTRDAFLVAKLRQAGAIILAKGGMDEFAYGMFGINSRHGRMGNAYDPTQNPGGSSGGPAAAVSANFALVGIGTDNSGSVRIPAAFNGIVGLRPSTGLISQQGIFPMGNLDGTAGPLARTVEDLALVLNVIAQTDNDDPKTQHLNRSAMYSKSLNANSLKGKRIGIVHQVGPLDTFREMPTAISATLEQSFRHLRDLGATLVDVNLNEFDNNRDLHQSGEIEEVNDYLNSFPSARANFNDICLSDRTRTFGDTSKCLTFITHVPSKTAPQYQAALRIFQKNKGYVDNVFAQLHLDALLIPISTNGSATYDGMSVNTWRAPVASNAGLPAIAITVGYDKAGMPIGVELVGKQFNEVGLINMAYALEKNSPKRPLPRLEENTNLNDYSVPEMNNLFSALGKASYDQVLKNVKLDINWADALTPDVFKKIVKDQLAQHIKDRRE